MAVPQKAPKFSSEAFFEAFLADLDGYSAGQKTVAVSFATEVAIQLEAGVPIDLAMTYAGNKTGLWSAIQSGLEKVTFNAAAYGFGIMPQMVANPLTVKQSLMADAWSPDQMTLSEKIHGLPEAMKAKIAPVIVQNMKDAATLKQMSLDMFEGYGKGAKLNLPPLPKYMDKVLKLAAAVAAGDQLALQQYKTALKEAQKQINMLSPGATPTKMFKLSYQKVLDAVQSVGQKGLKQALIRATNERGRYFADRIARTEGARAWAMGFLADAVNDPYCVALRWKLGSRHPKMDICDFLAKADLYGLGAGIYPMGKVPRLPAHPHCLCRYIKVFKGSIDEPANESMIAKNADAFLTSLSTAAQQELLGVAGQKQWAKGEANWFDVLKQWEVPESPHAVLKPEMFGAKTTAPVVVEFVPAIKPGQVMLSSGIVVPMTDVPKEVYPSILDFITTDEWTAAVKKHVFEDAKFGSVKDMEDYFWDKAQKNPEAKLKEVLLKDVDVKPLNWNPFEAEFTYEEWQAVLAWYKSMSIKPIDWEIHAEIEADLQNPATWPGKKKAMIDQGEALLHPPGMYKPDLFTQEEWTAALKEWVGPGKTYGTEKQLAEGIKDEIAAGGSEANVWAVVVPEKMYLLPAKKLFTAEEWVAITKDFVGIGKQWANEESMAKDLLQMISEGTDAATLKATYLPKPAPVPVAGQVVVDVLKYKPAEFDGDEWEKIVASKKGAYKDDSPANIKKNWQTAIWKKDAVKIEQIKVKWLADAGLVPKPKLPPITPEVKASIAPGFTEQEWANIVSWKSKSLKDPSAANVKKNWQTAIWKKEAAKIAEIKKAWLDAAEKDILAGGAIQAPKAAAPGQKPQPAPASKAQPQPSAAVKIPPEFTAVEWQNIVAWKKSVGAAITEQEVVDLWNLTKSSWSSQPNWSGVVDQWKANGAAYGKPAPKPVTKPAIFSQDEWENVVAKNSLLMTEDALAAKIEKLISSGSVPVPLIKELYLSADYKTMNADWKTDWSKPQAAAAPPPVVPVVPPAQPTIPTAVSQGLQPEYVAPIPPFSQLSYLKDGKFLGGQGKKDIYVDAQGNEYVVKLAQTKAGTPEAFRAYVQEGAAKFAGKFMDAPEYLDTVVVKLANGQLATVQRLVKDVVTTLDKTSWTKLTPDQLKMLQRQHVLDWVIGNFDAHCGNFIVLKNGQVIGVDKEQAFRYMSDGGSWKINENYHPNHIHGEKPPIYNEIYSAFKKKAIDLDLQAITAEIQRIEKITDLELKAMFRPYAEGLYGKGTVKAEGLLDSIVKRKNSVREDFREFFTGCLKARDPAFVGEFKFIDEMTPAVAKTMPQAAKTLGVPELKAMSVKTLVEMANKAAIKYAGAMTKEQLVTALAFPDMAEAVSLEAKNLVGKKAGPKAPKQTPQPQPQPAQVPKHVSSISDDIFASMDKIRQDQFGIAVRKDGDMIENQILQARRVVVKGQDGYQIKGRVTEKYHQAVVDAMIKAGATKGKWEFLSGGFNSKTGKFEYSSSQISGGSYNCSVYKDKFVEIRFVGSTMNRSFLGMFDIKVMVSDGQLAAQKAAEAFEKMGLKKAIQAPSADDEYYLRLMRILWQNNPKAAESLKFKDLTTIEAELRKMKIDPKARAAQLIDEEVYPGYRTYVDPELGRQLKAEGADYIFCGVGTSVGKLIDVLQSPGALSTLERLDNGIAGKGGSEGSDIGTGGADSTFTRLVTVKNRGESLSAYKSGGYRIIYDAEVLARTDWYSADGDTFGNTSSSHMNSRYSAIDFVKKTMRNREESNEIMLRKGIANKWIRNIGCDSDAQRTDLIAAMKKAGMKDYNGIPLDKFVIVKRTC